MTMSMNDYPKRWRTVFVQKCIFIFSKQIHMCMDGINGWIRPNAYEEKEESPT